jgi:electron transfer flavoprotein beta subunit
MNIVVCVKFTPDAGDIEVRSDGSISLERAEWGIGPFDLQALEAGMRLTEASGGKVLALSAGPRQTNTSKLKKDLLSRGPDELYLVSDDALKDAGTAATARVLAAAIRKMGEFDLVLCGEGSADLYFQQVGLQLGEMLGLPTLNAISKIETSANGLLVERDLDDEVEVLEVPLPAALSVTTDINEPRLPTMKEILKSGKKPVTEWSLADLGLAGDLERHTEILTTRAPRQVQRKNIKIEGSPDEVAQAIIGYLNKEGLI